MYSFSHSADLGDRVAGLLDRLPNRAGGTPIIGNFIAAAPPLSHLLLEYTLERQAHHEIDSLGLARLYHHGVTAPGTQQFCMSERIVTSRA